MVCNIYIHAIVRLFVYYNIKPIFKSIFYYSGFYFIYSGNVNKQYYFE